MRKSPFRRKVALLLLGAILATPWAAAAGNRPDSPRKEAVSAVPDLLGPLWSLLVNLWAETGCQIDPDGACRSGTTGAPAPAIPVDEGCQIDPNGACRT